MSAIQPKAPNEIDKIIGALVYTARRERKLSQEELANKVGITFQQIQKYERGINRISVGRLYQIAGALEKPVSYFFESPMLGELEADNTKLLSEAYFKYRSKLVAAVSQIENEELFLLAIDFIERLSQVKLSEGD